MNIPTELKYTRSHEWALVEQNKIRSGLTEYAQKELSDVVYVELPVVGRKIKQGESIAIVESVKAAFDIYAAVNGEVINVNKELENDPGMINRDCYGAGWLFEFRPDADSGLTNLLSKDAYSQLVSQAAH